MDFNDRFRILKLTVVLSTNATITTYNQNGIKINKLSGDLRVIHKIIPLLNKVNRRNYMIDNFNDDISVPLEIKLATLDKAGETVNVFDLNEELFFNFSKYIKKN